MVLLWAVRIVLAEQKKIMEGMIIANNTHTHTQRVWYMVMVRCAMRCYKMKSYNFGVFPVLNNFSSLHSRHWWHQHFRAHTTWSMRSSRQSEGEKFWKMIASQKRLITCAVSVPRYCYRTTSSMWWESLRSKRDAVDAWQRDTHTHTHTPAHTRNGIEHWGREWKKKSQSWIN